MTRFHNVGGRRHGKNLDVTAPIPLHDSTGGGRVVGVAVPLDLWGIFNGQPLARVEITPAVRTENTLSGALDMRFCAENACWVSAGAQVVCAQTDEEMEPDTDESGERTRPGQGVILTGRI